MIGLIGIIGSILGIPSVIDGLIAGLSTEIQRDALLSIHVCTANKLREMEAVA